MVASPRNANRMMDDEHIGDEAVDFGGDDGGHDYEMGNGDLHHDGMGNGHMGNGAVYDEEAAAQYLNSKSAANGVDGDAAGANGASKKASGGIGKPVPKKSAGSGKPKSNGVSNGVGHDNDDEDDHDMGGQIDEV